ncbi:hypothetical protein SAPIO_CDS9910 [Scedosporium apiospermum]|uniref:Uncharacterized protein n=1 Tax=Pseudallescheria apiosperma TaxID=563466 RepID=A0A084FVX7_PSEDA|nr:uncharacterized protein SAPIO_CDS9910 [Scedosporium apiospermum]KEZ39239.1 hypothetical protein SAPIO_CDS9910 [Scedosporium apiospermum]
MPSRSKGQNDHQQHNWEPSEVFELLAWLDYCLEHKLDFEKSVVDHLSKTTGRYHNLARIKRKLTREWNLWGSIELNTLRDLYDGGSKTLHGYTDEDRAAIRQAKEQIGSPSRRFRLRSASTIPSISSPPSLSSTSLLSSRSPSGPDRRQLSETATLRSRARSRSRDVFSIPSDSGDEETLQRRKVRKIRPANPSRKTKRSNSLAREVSSVIEREPRRHPRLPGQVDRAQQPARSSSYTDAASQTADSMLELETRITGLETELARKIKELEDIQRECLEHKDYVFTLSNRLSAAQDECDVVRHSITAASDHRDDPAMQHVLRYELESLRRQMSKIQRQRQAIAKLETDSLKPSLNTIREEVDLIKSEIRDACFSIDLGVPMFADAGDTSRRDGTTIDAWARRIAGCSMSKLIASNLAKGDGPEVLSQTDLLAHQSLISEPYFESDFLVKAVKDFTDRFCKELSNCMRQDNPIARKLGTGSVPPVERDPAPVQDILSGEIFVPAFELALKLKSKLLLSKTRYKLVFYKPGDLFDPESMTRDGDGVTEEVMSKYSRGSLGLLKRGTAENQSEIRLCIFPALYSGLEHGGENNLDAETDSIDRCIVNSSQLMEDGSSVGLQEFDLVVKAVAMPTIVQHKAQTANSAKGKAPGTGPMANTEPGLEDVIFGFDHSHWKLYVPSYMSCSASKA